MRDLAGHVAEGHLSDLLEVALAGKERHQKTRMRTAPVTASKTLLTRMVAILMGADLAPQDSQRPSRKGKVSPQLGQCMGSCEPRIANTLLQGK